MESQLNRWSSYLLIGLSTIALSCVLSGYLPGHHPQTDEGTAPHIFQLQLPRWFLPS